MTDYDFQFPENFMGGRDIETGITYSLPAAKAERPDCPFYGFLLSNGILIDTGGNQCSWMSEGYPCKMENQGNKPEWKECIFNNPDNRKALKEYLSTQIFPHEFSPKEGEWGGITLKEWIAHFESRGKTRQ
jgi:hypothetical protein